MIKLANLREIEVTDVLRELPDVQPLDVAHDTRETNDSLFLAALGFEDRCPWIPELLAEKGEYKTAHAVYFEYATNQSDNEVNKPRLLAAMESFASQVRPLPCDSDEFPTQFRTLLREVTATSNSAPVTFDISVCSSKVLVTALTALLEFEIDLRLVYSEAGLYHPTQQEWQAAPGKWTKDEELGLARGVSAVTPSPDHPGSRRDILPEAVFVFPTFKPERSRAIIAYVDESLLVRPAKRVIWLVGDPHLPEDHWRTDVLREINQIAQDAPACEVSTFDYKKTLEAMESAYRRLVCKYHVNIAPLGSKLQCVGIVLFWYMMPEVSIVFASPGEYNAAQYSEGCKAVWRIDFGPVSETRRLLETVGQLRVAR